MIIAVFLAAFVTLLAVGVPIAFALALSGLAMAAMVPGMTAGTMVTLFVQRMFVGVDAFVLLAVPLFILAGALMEEGGTATRLVQLASALVGRVRGSLALVTVLTSMFFAGISGSAVADTAAVGSVMIPAMRRKGYDPAFAAALQAGAGALGPIIPPSILMVIYGVIANVSVASLFLGGFVPGILIGLGLMALAYVHAVRRGYPSEAGVRARELPRHVGRALLPLLMPIIILGGILSGFFTPTESAAIAVIYALVIGFLVYRELPAAKIGRILYTTGYGTARVMFLIATANFVAFLLAHQRLPQQVAEGLLALSSEPAVILLLLNVFFLIVGCFLEVSAALIILGPVLVPVIQSVGIDPVHFGVVLIVNLCIGTITPPVGICLYAVNAISGVSIGRISAASLPVVGVMIAVLLFITYVPGAVLLVPRLFGY
ncbi:MAG: TRAP transporter large permease [Candidatus Rokubacteria bacterium]|nr:TRAP transporter large permease [Candidatus Rokubacteria bacterium]